MNRLEFHKEFRFKLDKVESLSLPEFYSSEIDKFLNDAILKYVKSKYGINNQYLSGFESYQRVTDDLKSLVKTQSFAFSTVSNEINTYSINLSIPYMYYLRGRVKIKKSNCNAVLSSIKISQQDDLEEIKLDPFNKPKNLRIVGYFENKSLYFIVDPSYVVQDVLITYLKYPEKINLLSGDSYVYNTIDYDDLSIHTHNEIIETAVSIALEQYESPRQQTQQIQLNKSI